MAIPNNSNQWPEYNYKHAEELMRKQCPQGYVIEREEEVVTGQVAHVSPERDRDSLMAQTFSGGEDKVVRKEDVKEWRIRYRAKDAPAKVPPQASPQGPPQDSVQADQQPWRPSLPPPAPVDGSSLPSQPEPVPGQ